MRLGGKGSFSGQFILDGREVSLRGGFDSTGKFTKQMVLRDGTVLDIDFTLEAIETGYKITGTITVDGSEVYTVDGDQRTHHPRKNPATNAGRYTLVLTGDGSPEQDLACGDGYATILVNSNGVTLIRGTLADGTRWTDGTRIRQNTDITILTDLYRKQGSIGGRLTFENVPGVSDVSGVLHWNRPAGYPAPRRNPLYQDGFDVDRTVIGSEYHRPAKATTIIELPVGPNDNLAVNFSEGGLGAPVDWLATLTNRNVVVLDRSLGRMRFNPGTGSFSGYLTDDSGIPSVKRSFSGVVLQIQSKGSGFFYGDAETGLIEIGAPPP